VIREFRDRDTAKVFRRERPRRIPGVVVGVALRKLLMLDAAESLEDLRKVPGNRLEKLRGDRKDQWSIRINDQWRVCFRWSEGEAFDVEITDHYS
jgi:proteic killer suppression protein